MSLPARSDQKGCRILTCYYRPKPGGFCKRLFRAINALLDRGHTVHYLAVVKFPIDHPHCHFHRFPWPQQYTSGYLFWGFFHLLAPFQLLYLGFRYRINRLFAFGGHNYALFLQPLKIIKRIPLTLFLRGDALENHQLKGNPSILIRVEHFLEGLAIAGTRLYGVSETLVNITVARHSFFRPLTSGVLRNDITIQAEELKRKTEIHPPVRLACVGLLEPRKNQRFLLKIMEKVEKDRAHLYLYGVGPDEDYLRKVVKEKNLVDRVHFMGWVEAEEIWPEVDLLLMPSLHEGAPNAVLEAIGNGVAVLVSNIPEHAEILPKEVLCDVNDSYGWVSRIEQAANDPKFELRELYKLLSGSMKTLIFNWDKKVVHCVAK